MTEAHRLYNLVVANSNATRYNYLEMGKNLSQLRQDDKYKEAVGDINTWNAFLKQPEIGLSVAEADKLIDVYETYVVKLGFEESYIAEVPFKNLKKLLPIVEELGSDEAIEYIEQAKTLSDKDFKEVIAENQNITERTYTYQVMKKCVETSNMSKVHGISSDMIKEVFNINEEGN